MSLQVKISVIIPTLNRSKVLIEAIASVCRQTLSPQTYEILIIDNGSTDETNKIVEASIIQNPQHTIRYFVEPVAGLLSGRHKGALEARGEILAFIDDDIRAEPKWLESVLNSFNDPDVHLVGGKNIPEYEVEPPEWVLSYWQEHPLGKYLPVLSLLDFGDLPCEIEPTFVFGLNFSIRKKTLIECGGFHPDCIPKHLQKYQGDGETGLSEKLKTRNLKTIYQPTATVYHRIPRSRLTLEYFDNWHFYQGVADSYSKVRASGKVSFGVVQLKFQFLVLKHWFIKTNETKLRIRFLRQYYRGYRFHQNEVRKSRQLLDWVLKKDYFDYKYL